MPKRILRWLLPRVNEATKKSKVKWLWSLANDPNLLQVNRHSVSIAVFIGIFIAFLPIPGQTIVVISISLWTRANLPIAAAIVWLSNPITIPPIFYLTYQLGSFLTGAEPIDFTIIASWEWFFIVGNKILIPLMIGGIITGLICGTLGYFLVLRFWRFKVIENWERRKMERKTAKENNAIID
ncbi:MAG: ATP-binding protein [Cellvibrionales bacterium TMED49]|nr:ATP-binding protein [Porticoccaceae bacterium]OUU37694.1 MAG: ATP-binding protein [Cellvibrionales bacterium TMED49]